MANEQEVDHRWTGWTALLPGLVWDYNTTYSSQSSSHRSKNEFCTKQSPWSFTTWYLTTWKSAASIGPHHTCPVAFWSLSAFEQLQGLHHQRHIRCLSGVWSGTTLCRASVQLSKPSDATYSARLVVQPGCGCRLSQPGQLTIEEELLGYQQQQRYKTFWEQQRTERNGGWSSTVWSTLRSRKTEDKTRRGNMCTCIIDFLSAADELLTELCLAKNALIALLSLQLQLQLATYYFRSMLNRHLSEWVSFCCFNLQFYSVTR